MDIFFPHTFLERSAFKESAVKCGFTELTAETTANVGILPAEERISTLLMAWTNIGNYLTKNQYNYDVGITVSWVGRCTLNLWFGREWIACAIENKTELIEQMMKVYPTAFITMHPYSWPYMFSIYRDPWMVEYLNLNFQRMSGSDSTPVLESKDSEFIQQEGIPLLILRMVNMFDFRMVKLVKYMCLRLLLTWQDANSTASRTLRASPNADQYINYARHIYLLAICESNGSKDLHYTLETIQRVVHCDLTVTWSLELGANAIAKGLQESNKTLTELLIAFLFKVPKLQFGNIFGAALTKYIHFITEYQLRNINRLSSVKLSWPIHEVYSKLVQMFITHRESSEELIKTTSKLSEQIFLGLNNLTASKCAYELIKQRPHAEWHTSKITLLLTIISEEINVIQDYKYNDVQSTDDLIEKEKEVAIYYRDLAKLFHKSPYLEQEAWLTTFSLHPCREFMDAVTKCGARNLRAIKKQAHKLKVIEAPEPKTKNNDDATNDLKDEDGEKMSQEVIESNVSDTTNQPSIPSTSTEILETSTAVASNTPIPSKPEIKPKAKRPPRKKPDKNGAKKIEPKIKDEIQNKISSNILPDENQPNEEKMPSPFKRGRPVGALGKDTKPRSRPTNPTKRTATKKQGNKADHAEEIFAAAAGASENINSQTAETIKYPAFALMNSVTDTEELMKFTNYDEAYEQYTELNNILSRIKLNRTCYEDLLTLLIAPRYKRLTWAVSWKKLKKRCRVIFTKDNKKRELVEQSMADANDRLTHLNIDYEKYKDKPQIDYGTIEGGYECFDTDSDDDDLKTTDLDVNKTKERPAAKKRVKKPVGSSTEGIQIKGENQNPSVGIKPYLKIENLDSHSSNLLNIIESTHLSKPVYLNKPVYFVRNPLASPSSETAISLDTGPENQALSRTSSRRSTGEETLTSDSFEEHHWHLPKTETPPEVRPDSQEQKDNISQLRSSTSVCRSFFKAESTFNIPASIKQQLEQPTMFFKSEPKNELNEVPDTCNQEDPQNAQYKQTEVSEALNFSPPKVTKIYHHTSTPNQINTALTGDTRFSPKLFEDMPEDLTMPKSSSNDLYETNTHSNLPLNLTSRLVTESDCKKVPFHEKPPNQVEQLVAKPFKKGKKQLPKSLTKTNSRKRQGKKDEQNLKKEELQDLKTQTSNNQISINQPTASLKSVRIFPHNKNSKAIRINPTAAVVFSSAAASYHRTPFLNVAQQEPNILQQLLSKEIKPFTVVDDFFDKTTALDDETVSKSEDERSSAYKLAAHLGAITVSNPINTMANSTFEVQKSNIQSLLSATADTSNINMDLTAGKIKDEISPSNSGFCDSELKNSSANYTQKYQALENDLTSDALQNISNDLQDSEKSQKVPHLSTFNVMVDVGARKCSSASENLAADESLAVDSSKTRTSDGELAANNVMKLASMINASILLDESKNIKFGSSGIEFEFKVPAAVAKPCFFMPPKQKKVKSYASDWVNHITFNDKTAEIIVPVSRIEKVAESFDRTKNTEVKSMFNEAGDGILKKLSYSSESSQSQSDDILYDKHIVFNKKLLDPHLRTYKNTKAPCKITDTKKLKENFSETDKLFSGKSEELNVFNSMDASQKPLLLDTNPQIKEKDETFAFESCISNTLGEQSTGRQSPSFLASTSQNIVHPPRVFLDSDLQQPENTPAIAKKRRSRKAIASTKKFDQMFEWIEMITKSNREPVNEPVDTSGPLLNLFSAQLMNKAKSIHFNYEYLREKEMLNDRANDNGVNCEASILIASPGPSEDCVKLIKSFKKSTVFKGVDMSSNEVSFTSSLAKEVLGTIVKVTLNDSNTHVSCCGNHFDASDALDEFRRSRRDANSPTFYSPTLSVKHLRNGTLADSVECIDTSLEKLIPKPGRKRSSIPAGPPVKKRVRKQKSIENTISGECKLHSLKETNQLPLKETVVLESPTESNVTDILKPLNVQENTSVDCSIMDKISEKVLIELPQVTNNQTRFPLEQHSLDQVSMEINSKSECNDKQTNIKEELMLSVKEETDLDICVTQKAPFEETLEKEKTIKYNIDTHESPEIKLNQSAEDPSGEEKLMYDSDEPINCTVPKPKVNRNPQHNSTPNNSISEYNDENTLNEEGMQSGNVDNVLQICATQIEPSDEILETKKLISDNLDSHELLDSKLNEHSAEDPSGEEKLLNACDEPINSKVKKPNINRNPHLKKVPTKRIQIERTSSVYLRTRRNTYDGTKYILKEETGTILSPEIKQPIEEPTQLSEVEKSDNGEEMSTKYSVDEYSSDEVKHLTKKYILKTTETNSSPKGKQLREEMKESEKLQIEDSPEETNEIFSSDETKQLQLGENASLEANQILDTEEKNSLDKSRRKLTEEINSMDNSEETSKQPVVEENKQLPMEENEIKYPILKISSEEENNQSAVKKRTVKPRISYAELDSDSDELPKSRLKIPSLKINFPSIRPVRRKLINRSLKKIVSNKSSAERPSKRIQKIPKEITKTFERSKKNPSSSFNDSDDDKPLSSKFNKPKNDEVFATANSSHRINESDDDAPLKKIPKRLASKKTLPPLKTKQNNNKIPVRKRYRNTYSPKRPSVRIQSKFSRPRTTSLNYFALFLSDSDEDELVKPSRRRCTPDRLWTRTGKRKPAKTSVNKKIQHQRKLRCSRAAIKQRQSRNRLPKRKTSPVKMPVLRREDSDHTIEENIYECATMSTANETDEDACSDHRPRRRRQKVVKPMRIRCVSRRAMPTDFITESSSCSSLATVQTARELGNNSASIGNFPKRGRLLRRNTLEKSLLMSKFLCESSSSSSPIMMNRRRRQFAVKSTSKPPVIKEHQIYGNLKETSVSNYATNAKSSEPLSFMEKEAIQNHNCVNFQIRLQRLTANEAILCRKPYVRLDRNFVENYFADKHLGYKEDLESEGLRDDEK